MRELASERCRQIRPRLDQLAGDKRSGFGEYDVHAEHPRMARGDLLDQRRDQRSRPRPLAVLRQALIVDRHDANRRGLIGARRDLLFPIEAAQREGLDEAGIGARAQGPAAPSMTRADARPGA